MIIHVSMGTDRLLDIIPIILSLLGGCPFNGPLSGTKYPTRAASPIQNASTPKSSLPFSKHRSCALLCAVVFCCAQVLVEHCTEFRTSFISN